MATLLTVALILSVTGCGKPSTLETIQKQKSISVITRNAPAIYYQDREGPAGFEYELAKMFADDLGVDLKLKVASNISNIFNALDHNYTDVAAAGMVSSNVKAGQYQFSLPYMEVVPVVVYRYGSYRPRTAKDLIGKRVGVIAESHQIEHLKKLKAEFPSLDWHELEVETIDLIKMVQEKELDYAVVTSNELDIHQAYYPRVKVAFKIGDMQQLVWYFPKTTDKTLVMRAQAFFERIEMDGTLLQLKERYFGHLGQLNYVGARTFIKHINKRLPRYEETFKQQAEKRDLDWRLMASIGYQESHWNSRAASPTGVRGLMMLTRATAKEMGVRNRLDPTASIKGGVKYFAKIKSRIDQEIAEPDRTWFALASYNVGLGHLEDARMLTEKAGKDPNKWLDVKEFLPLLQKRKYYRQTQHGYARGNEPVIYVQNIRRYYDVLAWMTQPQADEQAIALSDDPDSRPTPAP